MYFWPVESGASKNDIKLALDTARERYPKATDVLAYGKGLLRVAKLAGEPFDVSFNDFKTGQRIDLAKDYQGKIVLVDFWATWCAACVSKMPHLAKLAAEHEQTLQVVAFCGDIEAQKTTDFLAEHPAYDWPQYYLGDDDRAKDMNGSEFAYNQWGVAGWPTVILLDTQGRLRYRGNGGFGTLYDTQGEVVGSRVREENALDKLLNEGKEQSKVQDKTTGDVG